MCSRRAGGCDGADDSERRISVCCNGAGFASGGVAGGFRYGMALSASACRDGMPGPPFWSLHRQRRRGVSAASASGGHEIAETWMAAL